MKPTLFVLAICTWGIQLSAQRTIAEEKKELAEHPQQDTMRANRLIERTFSIYLSYDERALLAAEAIAICRKTGYKSGEGIALANLGFVRFVLGYAKEGDSLLNLADSIARKIADPRLRGTVFFRIGTKMQAIGNPEGLDYLLKAEEIFAKAEDLRRLASSQAAIANFYLTNVSNYPKAMEYILKSIHTAENCNYSAALFSGWSSMQNLYSLIGDHANALVYLEKAENEIKKAGVTGDLYANLQNNAGEAYRLSGKYREAIRAYKMAIANDSTANMSETAESNLADVYAHVDSLPRAFQYGFSSLAKAKQLQDNSILPWIHGILARAYLKKAMPDSAIYYSLSGLDIARETGSIEYMRDNAAALADAYAFKKDFARAYGYHLQYINYRDSMLNAEVKNKMAILQYNTDLDKKQAQITQLNGQKKAQQNFLVSALIVLLLILITAGLLLRNNRQKQKANQLLRQQKREIDDKAQELAAQKANVELLGDIGRQITSSLSVETIISTVYNNVNILMDATIFGIGIYHDNLKRIEFPATYENGDALPVYYNAVDDQNRFASICFTSGKEICMGNMNKEHKQYVQQVPTPHEGRQPVSVIFLPLIVREKRLGVITVQSFQENAYTDYHLYMLRTIAIYAGIALENAESYETLRQTVVRLQLTQAQLIQTEKMASLGELTAGIAHEIQNPLNFVNNFSEVSRELIDELNSEKKKHDSERNAKLENDLLQNIDQNLEKIMAHGKRADAIVKGMLQHSHSSVGVLEPTDINALADEYLRLSYHGFRNKDKSFNAALQTDFDQRIGKVKVVPQDIGRVILNMYNNSFYAVNEKKKLNFAGYEPVVSISTKKTNGKIEINIADNGKGIPPNMIDKIFQPFFTTKPTGQGTGLGLSLSYDIIKSHGGEIKVVTTENEGTTFSIQLPIKDEK